MIISHEHPKYAGRYQNRRLYNGAYFYSQEIVKYIIPNVKTDRNWITINIEGVGTDHAIVFIHNNLRPELYDWLSEYKDLILVCGVPETCEKVAHLGRTIYLPLSVKVAQVERYKTKKTRDACYVGRHKKREGYTFPEGTAFLEEVSREILLKNMAKFKRVYAVGRTAIEAKILDCEILPYDTRFPNPDFWKVLDSEEAAFILQQKLDEMER